jgi:hypothetical protein
MTMMAQTVVATAAAVVPGPSATPSLHTDGLCKACASSSAHDTCLGTLTCNEKEYDVYPAVESVAMSPNRSLADALSPTHRLGRVQRYGIALTLASSHLQLHGSSWVNQTWTCEDVLFPISSDNSTMTLHGEPYIIANMQSPDPANGSLPQQKDRSFSTLGIVLLELCFGHRLESHRLFQNPSYAANKADPMIRQAVACEWLDEVEDEAGGDYFVALNWTLKQAPAILKDENWRSEFAENVVFPLQRCYEAMRPK